MIDLRPRPVDRLRASNRRGKSRLEVAAVLYRELVAALAPRGCCAICGLKPRRGEHLEIDHVDGATWSRRALGSDQRVIRYWNEHETGVRLRAACRKCNRSRNQHALKREGITPTPSTKTRRA